MLPEFLREYESELKKYEWEFVKIKAKPRNELPLEDKLEIKKSKFLGIPFFPKSKAYPKDKNGNPMVMVSQLNFEEIPNIQNFPKNGILQLFFSVTNWFDEDSKVVYHSSQELNELPLTEFSFLKNRDYEELPIFKLHELSFELDIDKGGSEDSQFDFLFGQNDYWDFVERLTKDQEVEFNSYFDASGHKIGGYADFTQSDPRDYESTKRNDIQILQIDVDDEIMFGDSGIGHIFISKKNLINKNFDNAYFYWDCC